MTDYHVVRSNIYGLTSTIFALFQEISNEPLELDQVQDRLNEIIALTNKRTVSAQVATIDDVSEVRTKQRNSQKQEKKPDGKTNSKGAAESKPLDVKTEGKETKPLKAARKKTVGVK